MQMKLLKIINLPKIPILLGIVILILICLLAVDIILRLGINDVKFNNLLTPIITVGGLVIIIIQLRLMKKSNDEIRSIDFYNFYENIINRLAEEGKGRFLSEVMEPYIGENKLTMFNFRNHFHRTVNKIRVINGYEEDIQDIKRDKVEDPLYYYGTSYFEDMSHLKILMDEVSEFYDKVLIRLMEIQKHKVLSDNHKIFLYTTLIRRVLHPYLRFCVTFTISKTYTVRNIEIFDIDNYVDEKPEIRKCLDSNFLNLFNQFVADKQLLECYKLETTKDLIDKR